MNHKTKQTVEELVNDFGENLARHAKNEQEFFEMLKYAISVLEENTGEVA